MTGIAAECPECGPTVLRRAEPLLDGTPVSMCVICRRIDIDRAWRGTAAPDLRDLIADTIETAESRWEFESDASRESRAYVDPGPRLKYVAQAVLDELSNFLPKQETK